MIRILSFIVIVFSPPLFSQDFTHLTTRVAFSAGEMYANLKRCDTPQEKLIIFEESVETIKLNAFPVSSYEPYIDLFDESYTKGKKSVLSTPDFDKRACNKYVEQANDIIMYGKNNS